MIPRGICLDLETTITAKISDIIRKPGYKRYETRIIEIGAVHWTDKTKRFMRLVNPISVPLISGACLMKHLEMIHQKPEATVNFWSKVLVNRNTLDRTMFEKEEDPRVWLARQPESKANDFVRWFNGSHGPEFVSEKDALFDLLEWSGSNAWLAHNGNSFDFKVLQGCAERTGIPLNPGIKFHDTLRIFRKSVPGHKSYSQPIFYESLFSEKYNAHVAIDDALALARICAHLMVSNNVNKKSTVKNVLGKTDLLPKFSYKMALMSKCPKNIHSDTTIKTRRDMNLTFPVKNVTNKTSQVYRKSQKETNKEVNMKITKISQLSGVGPKTCQAFASQKVLSLQQLIARYEVEGGLWLKELLPFGANWKKVEKSILAVR